MKRLLGRNPAVERVNGGINRRPNRVEPGRRPTITAHALRPAWLDRWLQRHRHPASLVLHAIGIPATVAALVVAAVQLRQDRWDLWWRPVVLLVAGYVLQWLGHRIEGNDMGEVALVKKWLGRPYVAVSPRYTRDDGRA